MKFEKLQPGMVVYDVHRYKMGNTTISTVGVWAIRIISVDPDSRTVEASWNGNTPKRYREYEWSKWRLTKPMLVDSGFFGRRLATRAEIAAAKAKKDAE